MVVSHPSEYTEGTSGIGVALGMVEMCIVIGEGVTGSYIAKVIEQVTGLGV